MKSLLFSLILCLSFLGLRAQIEFEQMLHSKHMVIVQINTSTGEYDKLADLPYANYIFLTDSYYLHSDESKPKGDFNKVPWHFKEQTTDNKDIYLKENNREVIIDYQEQTITFNQNWNEVLQKYEMILTVSSFD